MSEAKLQELKIISLYDELYTILNTNLTDIKSDRSGNRWIYPTFPNTDNTENYPLIVTKLESPQEEPDSIGNFLDQEYDSENNVFKEYYYKRMSAVLNIFVLTEKDQGYTVTVNGADRYFKNEALNIYLVEQVKKVLRVERPELMKLFTKFKMDTVEYAFDNNKFSWAGQIRANVEYREVWIMEYQDGELLSSYTLDKTILEE